MSRKKIETESAPGTPVNFSVHWKTSYVMPEKPASKVVLDATADADGVYRVPGGVEPEWQAAFEERVRKAMYESVEEYTKNMVAKSFGIPEDQIKDRQSSTQQSAAHKGRWPTLGGVVRTDGS